MTLILTINGPETIWMLADRRLSYRTRPPRDDATKILRLDASDGIAFVGYAGLGETSEGTEPATWMSAVLRGRDWLLERSLGRLAYVATQELPRHLEGLRAGSHHIVATAFLDGEPRLYVIELVQHPTTKEWLYSARRQSRIKPPLGRSHCPPVSMGGSGTSYLVKRPELVRNLFRLATACDRRRVSHLAVADHLASLNHRVHLGTADQSVGPRCIVVWRCKDGRGAQQCYTGTTREANSPILPAISNGTDIAAELRTLLPHLQMRGAAYFRGEVQEPGELDTEAMNADLARLPSGPDDKLR